MAGTAVSRRAQHMAGVGDVDAEIRLQLNQVIADLELLRSKFAATLTKLDADAGVTDTNYSALNTVAAAALLASTINVFN